MLCVNTSPGVAVSFAHLSCRTTYSILDGAIRPRDLVAAASSMGQPAVAMTDHCGLYGAVEFHKASKSAGIQPIYGATIWTWPDGLSSVSDLRQRASKKKRKTSSQPREHRGMLFVADEEDAPAPDKLADRGVGLTLLIKDAAGYKNLCTLISEALEHIYYRPRTDLSSLRRHRDGLIALVGGWTQLVREDELGGVIGDVADIFGEEDTYIELLDTGLHGQRERVNALILQSAATGLPCVATNDVRYKDRYGAVSLDLLHSIQNNVPVDSPGFPVIGTDQHFLKCREEMAGLDFPTDSLDRTTEIAQRCGFTLSTGIFHFPRTEPPPEVGGELPRRWRWMQDSFPLPPHVENDRVALPTTIPEGWSLIDLFYAQYTRLGLQHRLKNIPEERHAEYRERAEYEIRVIHEMGFPVYMLIVAEFINWSKARGIPIGPGRGSVAGALSAWAMGITDLDSIEFSLIFERFLNPGRLSMPDVDVDFSKVRREEAIAHVRDRYGDACVAQIATLMACKPKSALKDAARALSVPFQESDQWSRLIDDGAKTLAECEAGPRIKARLEGDPLFHRAWTLARSLEGLFRQTGVHAAGVVIGDVPLVEYVPTYVDPKTGRKTVCADMDSAETQGLIKYDFLGLITLDVLKNACDLVEQQTGTRPDLNAIPLDDEDTLALLQRGETVGTFQMESSGMQDLIRRLHPTSFEHIIALVALYRPGPLQSGLVDQFVECRHGRQEVTYPWPALEPILSPTYGAIIYQEQVLEIARSLAGYSLAEADLMRRAIGKKKAKEMARQRKQFVAGCIKHGGVPEQIASDLFDIIDMFSGYSFNRSHSAAYGLISYQTAWLKANHPREYMAAVLSWESSEAKLSAYIQESRRMGLEIFPPDVNCSMEQFTLEGERGIRFGLGSIKGIGSSALAEIFRARSRGAFRDILDFGQRTAGKAVGKTVIEALAYSGAMDRFGASRDKVFSIARPPKRGRSKVARGQMDLFGGASVGDLEDREAEALQRVFGWRLKMMKELKCLGTWLSGHPLDLFGGFPAQVRDAGLGRLSSLTGGRLVKLVGIIAGIHKIKNFRGDRMAFLTLTDDTGWAELTCFPGTWAKLNGKVAVGQAVVVETRIEKSQDEVTGIVNTLVPLDDERARLATSLRIEVSINDIHAKTFEEMYSLLTSHAGKRSSNKVPVSVRVLEPGSQTATIQLPPALSVSVTESLIEDLEQIGVDPRNIKTT